MFKNKVLGVVLTGFIGISTIINPIVAQAATPAKSATTSNVTTVSRTNVTVNDGFATAIINVEITKKNNLYSISKTTFNPVKTNDISLETALKCKCLSSTIASGGSSASIKYSYEAWYANLDYLSGDYVTSVTSTPWTFDYTKTITVNMKIDSSTGKLTTVASSKKNY